MPKMQKKRFLFVLCVAVNAAIWFTVKVLPWLLRLFGVSADGADANAEFSSGAWIVPIGISYFTLQAIGYLTDVCKGRIEPEKHLWKYLLFLTYFPAIVQGPISRYDKLMPQLLDTKKFSFETMRKGLILTLFGLVKKMVVADRLGIFVNACFSGYQDMSGIVLYLAAVSYSVQLYMDFSGCVDICRGVSTLFHIELVNNFNRPYFATSVKDFWAKWHISLSSWLRDYIYIPLGGNRKGRVRKYVNLLLTFLVSGLWHGAEFSFFLWGALHAVFQIIGECTAGIRGRIRELLGVESGSVSERIYQTVITFNLVNFAWIFFRAADLKEGFGFIARIFSGADLFALTGPMFELGVNQGHFLVLLAHLCIFFVVELYTKSQDSAVESIVRQHLVIRWVVYLLLFFDICLFGVYGSGYDLSGFMYGGF